MSLTLDTTVDRPVGASPADPTTRIRRIGGALALPLAFALQLICNARYAWVSTESGLSDTEGNAETLEFYARYPGSVVAMSALAMVGVLIMIPGLLTALRVLRLARPRLALSAVAVMIVGYVCYFGILIMNFSTVGLAEFSRAQPGAGVAAMLDAAPSAPIMMVFFGLFVLGNLVGTLLLGLAVLTSRVVPWWAGLLIMGWPVGHMINLLGGGEWFAVAGGLLEVTGLAIVALAALRTSDSDWAARG
ncbi:MAG: hypothetical protein L0G99_07900 [Propionibacteriales bacterium]|nr:hypothetical protein [Propionibacteriales bacterium]